MGRKRPVTVRFSSYLPQLEFEDGRDSIDIWTKDDAPPWVLGPEVVITIRMASTADRMSGRPFLSLLGSNVQALELCMPHCWTPSLLKQCLPGCWATIESFLLDCGHLATVDNTGVAEHIPKWCQTILAFPNLKTLTIKTLLYERHQTESTVKGLLEKTAWLEDLPWCKNPHIYPTRPWHSTLRFQVIQKPTAKQLSDAFLLPKDVVHLTWSYL